MNKINMIIGIVFGIVVAYCLLYFYSLAKISEIDFRNENIDNKQIKYVIETYKDDDLSILLSGWVNDYNESVDKVEYMIILKNNSGRLFKVKTFVQSRLDLPHNSSNKYNYSFNARIFKCMLPDASQSYEVYLLSTNNGNEVLIPLDIRIGGSE